MALSAWDFPNRPSEIKGFKIRIKLKTAAIASGVLKSSSIALIKASLASWIAISAEGLCWPPVF